MLWVGSKTNLRDGSIPSLICSFFPNPEALTSQAEGHPDEDRDIQHAPVLPADLSASFYSSHSGVHDVSNEPSVAWRTYVQNQAEIK